MDAESGSKTVSSSAIILTAGMLISIGLVMVGSAGASLDRPLLNANFWTTPFGRQVIFAVCGLTIMLVTARLSVPILSSPGFRRRLFQVLLVAAILLLAAALVPGLADTHRGSNRWLRFDASGVGLGVQPSEIAKLALIGFLAYLLGDRTAEPRQFWRTFVPATLAIGVCVALIGVENLGTSALVGLASGALLFVAGCRWLHLLLIGGLGASGMTLLLFAQRYRLERLAAHGDLWADPMGKGYQPLQSLVTIASGGWWGQGLGAGVQKYGYLPESQTDFVYAVLCEELGVFGGALVILLFCAFVWLGLRTMLAAATRFERLLAFGLTFLIATQAAMNIAVVTVLTPTTGVPLPLISAGGSGMFVMCAMVGLLAGIAYRARFASQEAAA